MYQITILKNIIVSSVSSWLLSQSIIRMYKRLSIHIVKI